MDGVYNIKTIKLSWRVIIQTKIDEKTQKAIGNTQPPYSSDENISKSFGDKIFTLSLTYISYNLSIQNEK